MAFSDALANEILDHIFGAGNRDYTPPANIFIALSTADPGATGASMAEPSGNGYARVSTDDTDWTTAASRTLSNNGTIAFPAATGSWGTITHFALFTASSGGTFLGSGALSASKAIDDGDTAQFAAGDLDATL